MAITRSRRGSKRRAAGAARPAGDGLRRFAIHTGEARGNRQLGKLANARPGFRAFATAKAGRIGDLDPETIAQRHLDHALESDALPQFNRPSAGGAKSEFKSLGTETVPLTGTKTVKFRQTYNKIPVYGSLVTVELDEKNECLGINSSLGQPQSVDPVASIAPAKALAAAAKRAGYSNDLPEAMPRLYYYYDKARLKWALAFIVENVPVKKRPGKPQESQPMLKDYVVDAHKGTILAELPRTPTATAIKESAPDGRGKRRTFGCARTGAKKALINPTLNVLTHDFGFKDPHAKRELLPGSIVNNPPSPWTPAAVSAHANAEVVANFLRDVLKRNNIDNQGGPMISSINCVVADESPTPRQWVDARWNHHQMVYGQRRLRDGSLLSLAVMQEVVGHEMFHGVTEHSARLEYVAQSGALNESYSDIFGVIIANFGKTDLGRWDCRIGEGAQSPGEALRDLKDPTKHAQPKHMRGYVATRPPYNRKNDFGMVHTNSGIHNYAAYKVTTASENGKFVFMPREIAAMFYIALTQHLTRTSGFPDSRRAVVLAARTLFRSLNAATRAKKIKAIEKGFSAAGITA